MKYIALLILLSGCCDNNLEIENQILKQENEVLIKLIQQQEDEIEYLGHQLIDCQNK